jgi:hypothetical protein
MVADPWGWQLYLHFWADFLGNVRTSTSHNLLPPLPVTSVCKIGRFHGGVYKECSLLGYKNPVRTSQETHYVSATERSRLMLCKILGFHGGDWRMPSSGMLRRVDLVKNRQESVSSVRRLLVTANVVPCSPILVTLMIEALCSFTSLLLTRATRRNIPEEGILL